MKGLIASVSWLALLLVMPVVAGDTLKSERPNILLIVAEDMSSRVGSFGDSIAKTPAIDKLAGEGIRFPNTFTAAGVCSPSRAALITGVYAQSMGAQHMRTSTLSYQAVPPQEVKAFPELLRRAGYATANTVKTDYQFGKPFTVWDHDDSKPGVEVDLSVWRQVSKDKPFFAMITLLSTHERQLATPTTKPFAPWVEKLLKNVISFREKNVAKITRAEEVSVPPYYPDTLPVRQSIAQLYDNIHYMDSEVQQILDNLSKDGLSDSTIVIWTTDHGDGLPRAKRSVYDSGLQVPLVIRFPDGRGAGSVEKGLVSFVDLAPTILKLAGAEAPDFIQGRDFLTEKKAERRQYVYASHDRMDNVPDKIRAVRDQRLKYIRNYEPVAPYFRPLPFRDMFPVMQSLWSGRELGTLNSVQNAYFTSPRSEEELYDTATDPHEIDNLAADPAHADKLASLRNEMDRWLTRVGDRSDVPEEEMIEDMWPCRKQPLTAAPEARVIAGKDNSSSIELHSPTPGASIGYRLLPATSKDQWLLYSQPVALSQSTAIEAKAIRYGYQESHIIRSDGRQP